MLKTRNQVLENPKSSFSKPVIQNSIFGNSLSPQSFQYLANFPKFFLPVFGNSTPALLNRGGGGGGGGGRISQDNNNRIKLPSDYNPIKWGADRTITEGFKGGKGTGGVNMSEYRKANRPPTYIAPGAIDRKIAAYNTLNWGKWGGV